jgi:hypothetical protein
MRILVFLIVAIFIFTACGGNSSKKKSEKAKPVLKKGTYAYDRQFLKKYHDVIELKNGNSAVLLVADFQGRVMTSTCDGESSFGWINYDLISSGKVAKHINVFGGEERFWIGPEGGQFSIFFEKGKDFVFENWQVPAEIDTEPFEVVNSNSTSATFTKDMHLKNYSGTEFDLNVNRKITILNKASVQKELGVDAGNLSVAAFRSENRLKNKGQKAWKQETGLLSVWLLSMLNPSDKAVIVIPVKAGDEKKLGPVVIDDYFGKVSSDRLKVIDNVVYLRGDGKSRGKIGVPPLRAKGVMGSYDAENKVLTVLKCPVPENEKDYVNSLWKLQDKPYAGDAYNSYNDGPLDDGSQLGPFYELETSSPALALKPGEEYSHDQTICHFTGDEQELNKISEKVFGVSLKQITEVFQ